VQLCGSLNIFDIAFLWDWIENLPFPALWPLLSFPNLLALRVALSQHFLLGFEIAQLEFHHLWLLVFVNILKYSNLCVKIFIIVLFSP